MSLLRTGDLGSLGDRLREIVTPLMRGGRYIPLAGGRVREEIPWATYREYRRLLNDLARVAH